jgi:hypothetical protein
MKGSLMKAPMRTPQGALLLVPLSAWLLCLAGCPLQTPTFELAAAPGLAVAASSGAPLVNDTITLTASATTGAGLDLSTATWTSNAPSIVSLSSSTGAQVMALATRTGTATLTVSVGALRGSVTITVLASGGHINLDGRTSLALGAEATYTATVTDAGGRGVQASVTWIASGTVALATPGANTGASMRIRATAVGPGAVSALAGGLTAQIAVKVSATSGQLVISRADGTAVPGALAYGAALTLQAAYEVTNEAATDAQWTSTGPCTLVGSSGSTISVQTNGLGTCSFTATARGMTAFVSFMVVIIDGAKITGDASPMKLGEMRQFSAFALTGTTEVPSVMVDWRVDQNGVLSVDVQKTGNVAIVTATAVGMSALDALVSGRATGTVDLSVEASGIQISTPALHPLQGESTVVSARPVGPTGTPGNFSMSAGLVVNGAVGFGSVGVGMLGNGAVQFELVDAESDSPAVTVSYGPLVSNTLSFTFVPSAPPGPVAKVTVVGPQGPVRAGSSVDLTATLADVAGKPIGTAVAVTWTDATGVYVFPAQSTSVHVTAFVAKLGNAAIVATAMGVASATFPSPSVPGSVVATAFSPTSVAVGGTATTVVTVLDAMDAVIPGVPVNQVSMVPDDLTKVSVGGAVLMGNAFQFTATGLAAAPAPGIFVSAVWSDGVNDIMSGSIALVVTGP